MNAMYCPKQLPHKKLHITADKGSCQSSVVRYKQSRNSFKKQNGKYKNYKFYITQQNFDLNSGVLCLLFYFAI